jgi:RimJ/RimL family protein N-acetyltransferase
MIALTGLPTLHTDRLTLRAPKASGYEAFAALLTSPRAAFVGGPVPHIQAWRAFGHLIGHVVMRGYSMFSMADKTTAAPLGAVGPWFPEGWPQREIGWSIWNLRAEGQGLAHKAALATRRHAYKTLGRTTAISLILDGNTRSEALARRMGCKLKGEFTHEQFGKSQIFRHPSAQEVWA